MAGPHGGGDLSGATNIFIRAALAGTLGVLAWRRPLWLTLFPTSRRRPRSADRGRRLDAHRQRRGRGGRRATIGRQWLRCTSPTDEGACDLIDGANATTYKVDERGRRQAHPGRALRLPLLPWDLAWKTSVATAAIGPAATPTPPTS